MVNATGNWWGTASGPTNPGNTFNVGSQGDAVIGNVTFTPWLASGGFTGPGFQPTAASSRRSLSEAVVLVHQCGNRRHT